MEMQKIKEVLEKNGFENVYVDECVDVGEIGVVFEKSGFQTRLDYSATKWDSDSEQYFVEAATKEIDRAITKKQHELDTLKSDYDEFA